MLHRFDPWHLEPVGARHAVFAGGTSHPAVRVRSRGQGSFVHVCFSPDHSWHGLTATVAWPQIRENSRAASQPPAATTRQPLPGLHALHIHIVSIICTIMSHRSQRLPPLTSLILQASQLVGVLAETSSKADHIHPHFHEHCKRLHSRPVALSLFSELFVTFCKVVLMHFHIHIQ